VPWPRHPAILEVNTWVWLGEVTAGGGLGDVPASARDALAADGLDAVWLMGVWQRSPAGRAVAMADDGLQRSFRDALPDLTDADVVGSPYCVRAYDADPAIGGPAGLAAARAALAERGLRLVLDFVPNHVAPDHPWTVEHPERFVHDDDGRIANGRDPYFAPWPDVVQLNAFDAGLRAATVDVLVAIGEQCDGVRCDMAMLLLNEVFARTWGERAGPVPERDFWPDVIAAVRAVHPELLFAAEAYWDLEGVLLAQGFDACYDKRLHDRLVEHDPGGVRWQLSTSSTPGTGPTFVRFLENHDAPRAAATLGGDAQRAATVALATVPGATLWHEGQFEGRRVRVPVFLVRRPDEPLDAELAGFHRGVIAAAAATRAGEWRLLEAHGWPDNVSCERLVAWCWDADASGGGRVVVVVNLSADAAQALVPLPWADLAGGGGPPVRLTDVLDGAVYEREGGQLVGDGLFVDLPPWSWHWLAVSPGA
jgi:hypothetical protein